MAGFLFSEDHAPPFGPVAMACYLVAAIQLEFFLEKDTLTEQDVSPSEEVAPIAHDVSPTEDVPPIAQHVSPTEDVPPITQHVSPVAHDVVPDRF